MSESRTLGKIKDIYNIEANVEKVNVRHQNLLSLIDKHLRELNDSSVNAKGYKGMLQNLQNALYTMDTDKQKNGFLSGIVSMVSSNASNFETWLQSLKANKENTAVNANIKLKAMADISFACAMYIKDLITCICLNYFNGAYFDYDSFKKGSAMITQLKALIENFRKQLDQSSDVLNAFNMDFDDNDMLSALTQDFVSNLDDRVANTNQILANLEQEFKTKATSVGVQLGGATTIELDKIPDTIGNKPDLGANVKMLASTINALIEELKRSKTFLERAEANAKTRNTAARDILNKEFDSIASQTGKFIEQVEKFVDTTNTKPNETIKSALGEINGLVGNVDKLVTKYDNIASDEMTSPSSEQGNGDGRQ